MAKQATTIEIDPAELADIIQFKIKSVERAINTERNDDINEIRRKLVRDLNVSIASINQGSLPLKSTK